MICASDDNYLYRGKKVIHCKNEEVQTKDEKQKQFTKWNGEKNVKKVK